jgi:NADH dehydrogenase FAD-containing subunit
MDGESNDTPKELAGEIKDVYPVGFFLSLLFCAGVDLSSQNTEVTIVHGGSKLLNNTYPDKFRNALERSIRARGVDIILNDYVDNIPDSGVSRVTTRSGKTIAADLVVSVSRTLPTPFQQLTSGQLSNRGPRPNTDFVSSLGEDTLTKSGHVKVRRTLQLLSHSDVFAVGDVTDIEEQKQAGKVYAHADVVAANVLSVLEGKEAKSVYKGSIEMIVVTNGKVCLVVALLIVSLTIAESFTEWGRGLFRRTLENCTRRLVFQDAEVQNAPGTDRKKPDGIEELISSILLSFVTIAQCSLPIYL